MKKIILFFFISILPFPTISSPLNHSSLQKISPPQNIIIFIGDGMGLGQIEVARQFEYGKHGSLFIESFPHVALIKTHSHDNHVTDSAAAATAIATGVKTNNHSVGIDPNGKEIDSILDDFKKSGRKVGIVTTSTVTDATPASFTASVHERYQGQPQVARQLLASNFDVILGGGMKYFGAKYQNGENLIPQFEKKGYTFVQNEKELGNISNSEKLIGLFHQSFLNFNLDRQMLDTQEPTLSLMTTKAIQVLEKSEDGFFLMVESGRIDHASHSADFTSLWKEMIEFDRTIQQTWEWSQQKKDTLILVLSDHETMGFSVTEPMDIQKLKNISASTTYIASVLNQTSQEFPYQPASVKSIIKKYSGIDIHDELIFKLIQNMTNEQGVLIPEYKVGWEIGSLIASQLNAGVLDRRVRYQSSTGGHTSNMVPLFAYGPNSQLFHGVLNNTDIPKLIRLLMNLPS